MIVINHTDASDASASTTTLVTTAESRIPQQYYLPLVYSSILVSFLAFLFALIDIFTYASPPLSAPIIIAYGLLLPYHIAVLLLQWLQRHRVTSIFPFSPAAPPAVAYVCVLAVAWIAAGIVAAVRLHFMFTFYGGMCGNGLFPVCGWHAYLPARAAMGACTVEVSLIIAIGVVCRRHSRTQRGTGAMLELPNNGRSSSSGVKSVSP